MSWRKEIWAVLSDIFETLSRVVWKMIRWGGVWLVNHNAGRAWWLP